MRACILHIALITLLFHRSLYSQSYLPPERFTIQDGLTSDNITAIEADHDGYLWVGTPQGLNRFDGYVFRQFSTEQSGNVSENEQSIENIKSDSLGNLWILNSAGIDLRDTRNGVVSQYSSTYFTSSGYPVPKLIDVYAIDNKKVWALSDTALYLLSDDGTVSLFPIPAGQLLNNITPTCLGGDSDGNIWIGTSGGIIIFNAVENVFKEFMLQSSQGLLSDTYVQCLYLDTENNVWIGTRNGLNKFDPVDFDFQHFYPVNTGNRFSANNIRAISGNNEGTLILATDAGIISFDIVKQLFSNVYLSDDIKINNVTIDQSGIIWGGTDQGIIKVRRAVLPLKNYTDKSQGFKLIDNHIASLFAFGGNQLFIGYAGKEYDLVSLKTSKVDHYTTSDGSNIVNMYPFRQNSFIMLSENDLVVYQSGREVQTSLFSIYPFLNRDLIKNVKINCMFFDGQENIWLGTSRGIQHISFDSSLHYAIQQVTDGKRKSVIGQVFDIEQDASGTLWLATDQGLLSYNPKNGNQYKYTPYDKSLLNTENKIVYTLVPGLSGEYWLGTSGGAYKFELKNREFTAISSDLKVMRQTFKTIALDEDHNVWLGSQRGLYYYRRSQKQLMEYDQKDGLLSIEQTSICAGSDGRVYIGSNSGLSVLNVTDMQTLSKPNNIVITGLRFIENEPNENDLYIQLPDTLFLPWNRKIMQIDFAVLDFTRPELNRFMYAFGKTDDEVEWYHLGTTHHVSIEPLAPGKYLFKVTGTNSGMIWSNTAASLVIIVEAPYWRSKMALFLYIATGLILISILLWFFIRQLFNLSRENQEREMFARQIIMQKEELTLKNKSITDSINYAKRIQTAMLPPYKMFKSLFPSSFILYIPKDIVSGDFYWINKLNNKIFIAAVDCTGHGVPGAFMSIIGFELFRKITNIEGLTRPSDILNRLNEDFHVIFQDIDNIVLRDGMDVAFCSIDKKDKILEYSGAFNPLYLIRDNKITEIKGDRFAIGLDETNFKDHTFKNHLIPLQQGDIIYIFSDGFADQFGGPDGKKYKYRRFRHLLLNLHQLPMEKQHEILENNVFEWRGEQDQVDDILVIGIKVDF
jgi:ligand-binding sensor domain-containing protein/serine phosphatase RsbU (regulator of sigma subunit)